MLSLLRMTAGLLLVATLAVGCCTLQPAWLADLGLDVWSLPELLSQLRREEQRLADLSRLDEHLQEVVERKEAATQELIAGRMTLTAATEQFRLAASDSLPHVCKMLRYERLDATDAELLCFHVLEWVRSSLENDPERCEQVLARLAVEFCALRHAFSEDER